MHAVHDNVFHFDASRLPGERFSDEGKVQLQNALSDNKTLNIFRLVKLLQN